MPKDRGIYITADDSAMEQAVALLNSIRVWDRETPVILIPYSEKYRNVAGILEKRHEVKALEDTVFMDRLSENLEKIFGRGFFARPGQFRKQACWFGPFEEFLYIDTDIIVFEKIIDTLNMLENHDFICCDYQHKGFIKDIFTEKLLQDKVFSEEELRDVFNAGFWGGKKGTFSEEALYETMKECAAHREYFDFSRKTSDMPIFNYLVLKRIPRRLNIARGREKEAGSWAGSSHFQKSGDHRLHDPHTGKDLKYLHWAHIRIEPGCHYWDIWKYYRDLNGMEEFPDSPSNKKRSPVHKLVERIISHGKPKH